jgi:predicted metal-dependent enzyme (double-stranded beta helix superfamily)
LEHLKNWISIHSENYSRNSVLKTENFEIICCTWKPGQFSPIHDHADSKIFILVVSGVATETHYRLHEGFAMPDSVNLLAEGALEGEVDRIHRFGNDARNSEILVTLHLYLPPIEVTAINGFAGGRVFEEWRGHEAS